MLPSCLALARLSGDIIVLSDGLPVRYGFNVTEYCEDAGLESYKQVLLVAFTVNKRLLQDDESFKPVLDPTQVRISFFLIRSQAHFSQVDAMDSGG